jgi:hypothetical protein
MPGKAQEACMKIRILLCGIGLVMAMGAGNAMAQPAAAPTDSPLTPEGATKTPSNVPDVIEPPGTHADVIHPKETGAPGAVLTPPSVDPQMQVARPPAQVSGEPKKVPN